MGMDKALPAPGIPHQQPQGTKIPSFCNISRCWRLLEGSGMAELPVRCDLPGSVLVDKGIN